MKKKKNFSDALTFSTSEYYWVKDCAKSVHASVLDIYVIIVLSTIIMVSQYLQ